MRSIAFKFAALGISAGLLVASAMSFAEAPAKSGSRIPAPTVAPVKAGGLRFEQIKNGLTVGLPQMGGYLQAFDDATGEKLWTLKVYDSKKPSNKEGGAQEVFFKSMSAQPDGTLLIVNERGLRFIVDPKAKTSKPEP